MTLRYLPGYVYLVRVSDPIWHNAMPLYKVDGSWDPIIREMAEVELLIKCDDVIVCLNAIKKEFAHSFDKGVFNSIEYYRGDGRQIRDTFLQVVAAIANRQRHYDLYANNAYSYIRQPGESDVYVRAITDRTNYV